LFFFIELSTGRERDFSTSFYYCFIEQFFDFFGFLSSY